MWLYKFLLGLCFVACISGEQDEKGVEITEEITTEENILVLTQYNIKKAVEENKFLFVEFCKYWKINSLHLLKTVTGIFL